jgi:hypothetical protein
MLRNTVNEIDLQCAPGLIGLRLDGAQRFDEGARRVYS